MHHHNGLAILLDFDGTKADTQDGVLRALQYALSQMGRTPPLRKHMVHVIGEPIHDILRRLLGTEEPGVIERALTYFRAYYNADGKYQCALYDGIPGVLRALRGARYRLITATAKHTHVTQDIASYLGIRNLLDAVYGSERDGTRSNKAELIGHILAVEKLKPKQVVMIGDRKYDVLGAKAHGIPCIGVLWGYGSREELEESGAFSLAQQVCDIPALVHARFGLVSTEF